jgi:hypothetical protein
MYMNKTLKALLVKFQKKSLRRHNKTKGRKPTRKTVRSKTKGRKPVKMKGG